MTDPHSAPPPGSPAAPAAAEMRLAPPRRRWWQALSPVWLVPLVALVVALGVAWQSYASRGQRITIAFQNASGIEAGQTAIKYRDVTVGQVEELGFDADLQQVIVQARVSKAVAPYLDQDARFWVVRPEVSVRGVTGLNTVLSGAYIAGIWDATPGQAQQAFTGLEQAPIVGDPTRRGVEITLRLRDGNQIAAGAPILHKGLEVGQVGAPRLSADGAFVLIDAHVEAPFAARLTTASRFWDASGFDVRVGTGGLELDVKSLASLIEGGISFDTVVSGGEPVETGQIFDVFPDERQARDSVFTSPNETLLPLSVVFDSSVSGLSEGADVVLNGLKVGRVNSLGAFVEGAGAARRVRMLVALEIGAEELGLDPAASPADFQALIGAMVRENGLRARLATGSIFTGSLVVELVELPDSPPADLILAEGELPRLPAAASAITDFSATSQGVLDRVAALPVEEMMGSAIGALDAIRALAEDPQTRRLPQAASGLLETARDRLAGPELDAILADLAATAGGARAMLGQIDQARGIQALIEAIGRANTALAGMADAAQDFPQITAQIRSLTERLDSLPLQDLARQAEALLASTDAILQAPGARDLPASLVGALDETRAVLAEIRAGGAIEKANAALSAAEGAALAVNQAAAGLPALSDRVATLVASANGLVSGYGERSRFNADLTETLRQIQAASAQVARLARAIERNPNSLLLGR